MGELAEKCDQCGGMTDEQYHYEHCSTPVLQAPSPDLGVYYRIEDKQISNGCDEFDNPLGSHTDLWVYKFKVLKRTNKGVWIEDGVGMGEGHEANRFVLNSSRKRFACESLELAKESFRARKRRQVRILEARVREAKRALALVERLKDETGVRGLI